MRIDDYRHDDAQRLNNPEAGLVADGVDYSPAAARGKAEYAYNPHLDPVLRFDAEGGSDRAQELLAVAAQRALNADERAELQRLLSVHEPWLEWTGKREAQSFVVDPVPLHIHERVSAEACLSAAQRRDIQMSLFAEPELELAQRLEFYKHGVDWTNRLILGDSLQVMASLARREGLAGKVQMIYLDPPYGIKFASNFQPEIGQRDVRDRDDDLTREPEQVKAYRDTWRLGIHSYLSYLRDRLVLCRELLADTGSIFVQISDENLHRVRMLLDEVFGCACCRGFIAFKKTGGQSTTGLAHVFDYLLWYSRSPDHFRYRQLYAEKTPGEEGATNYSWIEQQDGERRPLTKREQEAGIVPDGAKVLQAYPMFSEGPAQTDRPFDWGGQSFSPSSNAHWKTTAAGLERLAAADRLLAQGKTLRFVNYLSDYSITPLINSWSDTQISGFNEARQYVVQTLPKVIERCLLMTTDPGDLVLDPTCGSGTTAFVAEQWGRRWITTDTSRVAVAIARQRLLTAKYDYYALTDDSKGIAGGFNYRTAPHITLGSIAQNAALDPILAKHEPMLAAAAKRCNEALAAAMADDPDLRVTLRRKMDAKQKAEGKRSLTDADERRWILPPENRDPKVAWTVDPAFEGWYEWEIPFDTDDAWPKPLQSAVTAYRQAWRAKMDEVNACIAAAADQEELVDQPEVVRGIVRVSGPFTVEAVQPPEMSLEAPARESFAGEPDELDTFTPPVDVYPVDLASSPENVLAHLDRVARLLRQHGIRFLNNQHQSFTRLERADLPHLHAEGAWESEDGEHRVAVSIGPEHGPITALQVEEAMRSARREGFDDLVFAGFTFDSGAQAAIQDGPSRLRLHMALMSPDIQMEGLLKETRNEQLFTVFGEPRARVEASGDEVVVHMEGVDIYDPVQNTISSTGADKVAAWFLDTDYDMRAFCICQAFFPDRSAWDKLARALRGTVDEEAFEAFSGTVSLPFKPGKHRRAAVKVIDPRGNEVLKLLSLE